EETPLSYADRPPPTPPPPASAAAALDDVEDAEVPPPFMVAIASPEPPLLANIRRRAPERPPPAIPSESSEEVSVSVSVSSLESMLRTDSEAGAGASELLSRPASVRVPASRPESIGSAHSAAAAAAASGRAESLVVRAGGAAGPPNRERERGSVLFWTWLVSLLFVGGRARVAYQYVGAAIHCAGRDVLLESAQRWVVRDGGSLPTLSRRAPPSTRDSVSVSVSVSGSGSVSASVSVSVPYTGRSSHQSAR
ncbi:hypothetical protein EVG20_g10241, partial [Dentipellis fragilis]